MEVYLVGGAVRDELLGMPVGDRDWCVVGETPDSMSALGYRPVGRDFPVFLHPETNEEYALARTERKTGRGYRGFAFHTAPDVSIEDDLRRRDLTINAMARAADGRLIDPFGGAADIERRCLRHTSDAFAEDPVRILRTARFAARLHCAGFAVAPETMQLMAQMVESGEADALVPDRVWKETERALAGKNPQVFFETLRACAALRVIFPDIDRLFGIPQPRKWHPEIDSGVHTMMVLALSALLSDVLAVRFAALVHDLGKGRTPAADLPKHPGHERRSIALVRQFAERFPVPASCRDLGLLVAEFHAHCHRAGELRPETVLKVLERTDAFRRPERFAQFLVACEADARGRTGFEDRPYPQAAYFQGALDAARDIETGDIVTGDSRQIARKIRERRLLALRTFKSAQLPPK